MKISKKDAKLLLYTAGLLTLLLVFVLVYQPKREEIEALEIENAELQAELAEREIHAAKKEEYLTQTKKMRAQIDETFSIFPAAVKEEDIILYAHELETKADLEIASVSIGALNQIWETGEEKQLYGSIVGYTFTVPYDDLKRTVEAIQTHDDKRNVESVVLSFDAASGKIIGSMNVNFYSMTGNGKEYQEPEIPGIHYGTKNIFGTISSGHAQGNTDTAGNSGD